MDTLIHYPIPIPRQPAFAAERPDLCPIADVVSAQILSLPFYPSMPERDLLAVSAAIRSFSGT